MQKGTVINLGQFKTIIVFLKKNWTVLSLTLFFLIGLTLGSVLIKSNDSFFKIALNYSDNFLDVRYNESFMKIFFDSFVLSVAFNLAVIIFGTSVIGITIVPLIISFRGFYFGTLTGVIYSNMALNGIIINALVIIPSAVISVVFLIISGREAMRFSSMIINITLPNSQPKNLSPAFSSFIKKSLLTVLPIIFSSLLEAWLSQKTMTFFDL